MSEKLFEAFITLFVTIEPFGLVPIFIALTSNETPRGKRWIAFKATVIAGLVTIAFAFIGSMLFTILGISEPAFRIAGGILLLIISIDLVIARHSGISSTTKAEEMEAKSRDDISVFPLAIPLIAGPGTLTTIVLLMRKNDNEIVVQLSIIAILILVLIISFICLLLSEPLSRVLGITGSNVINRVLGIVLAALAIQFILDGFTLAFFTKPH
jgi:multiple antibiotic resistance protein